MTIATNISLQQLTAYAGYFNIKIKINNTNGPILSGVRLRPIYMAFPDGVTVITDPQWGAPLNASYDPLVVASWTLPTIAAGATYIQTSILPVSSAIYQSSLPHICYFYIVQEGVAILSNLLTVSISPYSEAYFADPLISSLHNNTDILNYQATIASTSPVNAFTSNLDSANLATTANLQLVSTSAADIQMYRLLGLDGSGNVLSERGLLTGTSIVNSRSTFSYLYDVFLSCPANGNVTVKQSSTTYATVPTSYNRSLGFRCADNRPRLIHSLELGCDSSAAFYLKLTATGFSPASVEAPLFDNVFQGPVSVTYFYPPISVPANSIVRGYSSLVSSGSANLYGALTTAPVFGF